MFGRLLRRSPARTMAPPRAPAASGFTLLDVSKKVEEENFPWYSPSTYYNVRIGQLFQSRYQVLSKLGYGTSATVWLCRDLAEDTYVALKVCIRDYPSIPRETFAFDRLRALGNDSSVIQQCLDTFTVDGTGSAVHHCFIFQPLSISLAILSEKMKRWDLILFRQTALRVLEAVRYLHEKARLIHCDLRQENFLLSVTTDTVFQKISTMESQNPSPRKVDGQRVIHTTPYAAVPEEFANIVLSDLGEARPGNAESCVDDIQPMPYRAPEVLLDIPFTYPVDVWNVGVMLWHLFEGKPLFQPWLPDGEESNFVHLQQMVAMMGTPPPALLRRSQRPRFIHQVYFDTDGQWIGPISIPTNVSFESKEVLLADRNKAEFLRFIRRCLQWEPEKRATAAELCEDPWLIAVNQ